MAAAVKMKPVARAEEVWGLLARTLTTRQRNDLWQSATGHLHLNEKDKIWVGEYIEHGSSLRASQRIGYKADAYCSMMRRPNIAMAVDLARKELDKQHALNAEYVRNYLHSILELCPTDYCVPAPDGGWMLDASVWQAMPREVKRLVEDVELRQIRGNTYFAVRFVSKSNALRMAAQFTLTQKHEHTFQSLPWDEITADKPSEADANVEAELDALRALPSPAQTNGATNGHH